MDQMDAVRMCRHPSPIKGFRLYDRTLDEIIMRQGLIYCSKRKTKGNNIDHFTEDEVLEKEKEKIGYFTSF